MDPLPKQSALSPPPVHVAIIMDGNGRWAAARGLPRIAGHRQGAEALRRTVIAASKMGIRYLTVYSFSSENWKRPDSEIRDLMGLLSLYLRREIGSLNENGVRLKIIGDRSRLPADIVTLVSDAEEKTRSNSGLTLVLAINYGARAEIVHAARRLVEKALAGDVSADAITESLFSQELSTAGLPDPDLLIRTSGEMRLSNFLLWQSAYAEFVFTDVLWPDFDHDDLARAIEEYNNRERRYGASSG